MMNLLSPQAYRTLTREYWLRICTVWAVLLSGLCLTLTLLLLPTYVLIHSQLTALESEEEKSDEIVGKFKAAEASIKEANRLVDTLAPAVTQTPLSKILDEINTATGAHIELMNVMLIRSEGVVRSVEVRGEARSRNDLIQFKSALERSPLFDSVTVPLGDLARDTNLPFGITIFLTGVTK